MCKHKHWTVYVYVYTLFHDERRISQNVTDENLIVTKSLAK